MASPGESPQGRKTRSKGMKRCPHCGAKNKEGFEYCVRCSESLDEMRAWGEDGKGRSPVRALLGAGIAAILAMTGIALVVGAGGGSQENRSTPATMMSSPARPLEPRTAPIVEGTELREAMAAYEEGLRAYNRGDYGTTILHLREAARDLPGNPLVHQYLGLAYHHEGDYAGAKRALEAARELRPDSFELLDHYVTTCKEDDDIPRAMAALRDFLDDNPDDLEARLELVRLARETGDAQTAAEQAALLASEDEEDAEYVYEYGVSLKEAGKLDEAIEALQESVALEPESAVAQHALGVTELLAGHAANAVEALEAAVTLEPDNADFRFSLAQAYEKLDRVPESLAAYDAYLKHAGPDDTRAAVVRRQLEIAKKAWAERERGRQSGQGESS